MEAVKVAKCLGATGVSMKIHARKQYVRLVAKFYSAFSHARYENLLFSKQYRFLGGNNNKKPSCR